jgi:hypothetical protein
VRPTSNQPADRGGEPNDFPPRQIQPGRDQEAPGGASVIEHGPAADRQAIVGYLSLAHGADKQVVLRQDETIALAAVLAIAALLVLIWPAISRRI